VRRLAVAAIAATSNATPAPDRAGLLAGLGDPRIEDTGAHYDRADWGRWSQHNGCNTRELLLQQTARPGSPYVAGKGCQPVCRDTGTACWVSRYDGAELVDPETVQVDHVVPLREATRSGARSWTDEQRTAFYNDPANLWAVSASSNASKGDSDPAWWRPPDRSVWCDYASTYAAVKTTYRLTVDTAERDALAAMLATCPGGAA